MDTAADAARELDALATKRPDVLKIFYDHRGMDGGPDVADGEEGALGVAMRKEVMIALVEGANARHIATEVHIALLVDAGLSPWDALAAATTRAGDLLGRDYGIAPGAEANVLVPGGSPIDAIWSTTKLEKVIHHGRVVKTP